jgi:hypothetical protein
MRRLASDTLLAISNFAKSLREIGGAKISLD